MAKEQYLAGLDIGTQTIRVVQAKLEPTGELAIVGASVVEAAGMRRGVIVDIDEAVSSITAALEKVERLTGVPVNRASVSVGGSHIACLESRGVIAVSRPDGEITEADVMRVIDASQAVSIPANREVLHVIPKTFTLDGQTGIKDPIGMTGIRLEVESVIIHGALPFLRNLHKAINQAGVEIDQLVVSSVAAAQSVLTRRQRELGVAVLDFGAGTTSLAVYEENNLLAVSTLPVGSNHITNDIAIGLRCAIDTAEKVKLLYGLAAKKPGVPFAQIDLSQLVPEEEGLVSQQHVMEIINARLEELFDLIGTELRRIGRDGQLPAGIIITGSGAHLHGLVDYAKSRLGLPVQIGQPQDIIAIIDHVLDPSFATVTGLVLWSSKYAETPGAGGVMTGITQMKWVQTLQSWFKSFLP